MNFWEGKLIRLRAVEPEDAELLSTWNLDSERGRALDFLWPPSSLAQVKAFTATQSIKKLEDDTYHWVIERLDLTPVGSINTHIHR